MKLQQGQIWKCGDQLVRIVHLERLEVGYKSLKNLKSSEGAHKRASKKEFCRMLKGATLITDKMGSNQKSAPAYPSQAPARAPNPPSVPTEPTGAPQQQEPD